jgi:hypothetical protein
VVAISAGAYPGVADKYLLLPHGASVGRGFGPVVVAKAADDAGRSGGPARGHSGAFHDGLPGVALMQPAVVPVVVPIAPFSRVFEALDRGEVDAALLIHEGRLLFERRGCVAVAELGEWWLRETGLPLPLGVNVIRRDLGEPTVALVSDVLRAAIAYALDHREEVIRAIAGRSGARPPCPKARCSIATSACTPTRIRAPWPPMCVRPSTCSSRARRTPDCCRRAATSLGRRSRANARDTEDTETEAKGVRILDPEPFLIRPLCPLCPLW